MRLAIIGCGFVADLYMKTLRRHPELWLVGVADRVQAHAARFAAFHGVRAYPSVEALLDDPTVDLVLNLTTPQSHAAVSRACLFAGKHVYSEKPLALSLEEAEQLVHLAEQRGLYLSSAPSRLLGVTAQTMWKVLREGGIGTPRLAYAELDDGLVHRMRYDRWMSASGAPWPYKNEFETGCTVEHAGYAITWLTGFFGPARSVTAFSHCLIPDKQTPLDVQAPDFSLAAIHFRSGPVARLTCSIVAPADHSVRIFGDEGTLSTEDCWSPQSPVYLRRRVTLGRWSKELPWRTRVALLGDAAPHRGSRGLKKTDFCLGPAELAQAIAEGRPCRLSARFCLHTTEILLAIQEATMQGRSVEMRTTFDPIDPMPWASDAAEAARAPRIAEPAHDAMDGPPRSGVGDRRGTDVAARAKAIA